MRRNHIFEFTPLISGQSRKYIIDLDSNVSPIRFWTITNDMRYWDGEILEADTEHARVLIRHGAGLSIINAKPLKMIKKGCPCVVMEHLTVDGKMEYVVYDRNILQSDHNFINYGIPGGKHLRIDIYTGESRIING